MRALPVAYDAQGKRARTFGDGAGRITESTWVDWPLRGPRTALWCVKHVGVFGGSFLAWHTRWVSEQKLDPLHPNVTTHESCCRALDAFITYDQLNVSELAGVEVIARQLQLAEERERESSEAKKPKGDKADLVLDSHLYLGGGHNRGNLCICPALNAWIAAELQSEAAVLKERRKAREERALRK